MCPSYKHFQQVVLQKTYVSDILNEGLAYNTVVIDI